LPGRRKRRHDITPRAQPVDAIDATVVGQAARATGHLVGRDAVHQSPLRQRDPGASDRQTIRIHDAPGDNGASCHRDRHLVDALTVAERDRQTLGTGSARAEAAGDPAGKRRRDRVLARGQLTKEKSTRVVSRDHQAEAATRAGLEERHARPPNGPRLGVGGYDDPGDGARAS
jgi:hypothetical protein